MKKYIILTAWALGSLKSGNAQMYVDFLEKDSALIENILHKDMDPINSPDEIPKWTRRMHRDYGTYVVPKMTQFDNSEYQWAGILSGISPEAFICGYGDSNSGCWVSLFEYGQTGFVFYSKFEKRIIIVRTGIVDDSECPTRERMMEILWGNRRRLIMIQDRSPRCFLFLRRTK